eukprot:6178679-Pleurochrysis_carterae.AAC.1
MHAWPYHGAGNAWQDRDSTTLDRVRDPRNGPDGGRGMRAVKEGLRQRSKQRERRGESRDRNAVIAEQWGSCSMAAKAARAACFGAASAPLVEGASALARDGPEGSRRAEILFLLGDARGHAPLQLRHSGQGASNRLNDAELTCKTQL